MSIEVHAGRRFVHRADDLPARSGGAGTEPWCPANTALRSPGARDGAAVEAGHEQRSCVQALCWRPDQDLADKVAGGFLTSVVRFEGRR